jgi:hypothetical protein
MMIKRVQEVGIKNFEVIFEEHVMAHIQNHTNQDFETLYLHHFSSYLQRIDADKTRSGIWNSKFCDFL